MDIGYWIVNLSPHLMKKPLRVPISPAPLLNGLPPSFFITFISLLLIIIGIILLSIFWTTYRGAPWAPMTTSTARKILLLAKVKPGETVFDLGCGDGRVLLTAARQFGAQAVGIELDPLRYLWSRLRVRLSGLQNQIEVRRGDIFKQDLSQADVVTLYLLQKTNVRLMEKFQRELRPGTRIISYAFIFPGWTVRQIVKDAEDHLYIYVYELE